MNTEFVCLMRELPNAKVRPEHCSEHLLCAEPTSWSGNVQHVSSPTAYGTHRSLLMALFEQQCKASIMQIRSQTWRLKVEMPQNLAEGYTRLLFDNYVGPSPVPTVQSSVSL